MSFPPPSQVPSAPQLRPPPNLPRKDNEVATLLICGGLALGLGGLLWWWFSRPSARELRTEEVLCALPSNANFCDMPEAAVVGPAILAVVGAFGILLGVILYSKR